VCVCMRVDQGEVGVERVCLGCAEERRLVKFVPLLAVRMPFVERSRRAHAHTHGHTHTHKHKHTHTHTHTQIGGADEERGRTRLRGCGKHGRVA
jgi:hypothetical protein